jgi:hypothetical protein
MTLTLPAFLHSCFLYKYFPFLNQLCSVSVLYFTVLSPASFPHGNLPLPPPQAPPPLPDHLKLYQLVLHSGSDMFSPLLLFLLLTSFGSVFLSRSADRLLSRSADRLLSRSADSLTRLGLGSAYSAPADSYGAPTSTYGAPATSYSAPASTYGAPASTYGAPASTYGAPASTYGAPASTYGAPASSYGAPASTYGAPASTYGAPASTYGAPPSYAAPTGGIDLAVIIIPILALVREN